MLANRLGFIGAGRMATALARGLVRAKKIEAAAITASDPEESARSTFAREVNGAAVAIENAEVAQRSDVLVLAIKPQQMDHVLAGIREALRREALVISIAAGITLDQLSRGLPERQRIIRVMPNTPCLIGRGVSCYSRGAHAHEADGQLAAEMFTAVGAAYEVEEALLDAVTGLSGSGPAFVYTMIEALADGGASAGLPEDLALELAARTVAGAADMVRETAETPAVLRDRVTSPGGTTQAGLAVLLERDFNSAVVSAVIAAARRSAELGRTTH